MGLGIECYAFMRLPSLRPFLERLFPIYIAFIINRMEFQRIVSSKRFTSKKRNSHIFRKGIEQRNRKNPWRGRDPVREYRKEEGEAGR